MSPSDLHVQTPEQRSLIGRFMRFCLTNRLVVALFTLAILATGLLVAPFDWQVAGIQRYPVPVDAIPDIGENQQIVFTQWMGRSPQDMEDQISYPLTVSLLGIPGVKSIRSFSMFGFSTIYIIFKEDVEFYWSRTRVLEKLNSLPAGTLPEGVNPALGPDSTALGQIFWYTLEGRDEAGNPTGGWSQEELRSLQDWQVRYGLLAAEGVSEVGSIGGYVKEYQVDVDPDALRAYGVTLEDVFTAVRAANIDVGAKTIEMNRVEYFIRGIGFIKRLEDIENSVVKVSADHVPILVKQVAHVSEGPAARRGALDKGGAPAVGGVVVARYGDNPLAVITRVKEKIAEIAPALPRKTLADGTVSHVEIVPFYDRTGLIYETLATLSDSIILEILVTIIVVLVMVMHLRSSLLISGMLPLAVLLCFVAMKVFGVQANIVALSGIVIAIGTIVDMGIVICENILRHLNLATPDEPRLETVHRAISEVGSAVFTAVMTTVVSFLPVFTMMGAEGKLFKPLAFTKTFALLASIFIALAILPAAAYTLFGGIKGRKGRANSPSEPPLQDDGSAGGVAPPMQTASADRAQTVWSRVLAWLKFNRVGPQAATWLAVLLVGVVLTKAWAPLGPERGFIRNALFILLLVGGLLGFFIIFQHFYARMLRLCLRYKAAFLSVPLVLMVLGSTAWLGFDTLFGFLPDSLRSRGAHVFPGFGKEFMPPLDEGSFLWMPTTMTHASMGEALEILSTQDQLIQSVPEVESVVGKLGRADTPLDPAPVSMFETVINYKSQYVSDDTGRRLNFRYDRRKDTFVRDESGELIPDPRGRPFRQWREHIQSPDDIWAAIVQAAKLPGVTSAPKLQPIAARIVMLQSGMRAPMGVKIKGPDLDTIEKVGLQIEHFLKEVPSVEASAVIADRIVGKPYLEIVPDRKALARYGIPIRKFQDVVEVAIGGRQITTTVEGRERYPVRVRYPRELRDSVESMERILVSAATGQQIPLTELADIRYVRGPQMIKSEDTFLIGYVVFDKQPGRAEVDVVEEAQAVLQDKIDSGEFSLPKGVNYTFAGSYENQIRASKTLALILPVALFVIFMLIYFQFKSVTTTAIVFSGIFVAWSGGFLLIWLYGQPWFMDFSLFGVEMRTLFQIHPLNMSVAVWVGFLALFGIASDNGVIQSTYLDQVFREDKPATRQAIHEAVVVAAERRVRPCLMTSATTILALIPVLTSTGRGSDVMVPMAIPSFGGMLVVLISIFVVPVLYAAVQEIRLKT
ncbi:MAG: efflux RND transporter permease subunit [Kiritimatiellae bacterium]|nr:efflux RND transporter permease subunit [Kiritimatiellia bacterium]MDD4341177.1 efflux RND transporter permease subunit [Kiritimatiellia bacterium]